MLDPNNAKSLSLLGSSDEATFELADLEKFEEMELEVGFDQAIKAHEEESTKPLSLADQLSKRTVRIQRNDNGYGMRVQSWEGLNGVRISAITPGGAADQTGQMFAGDLILEVLQHSRAMRVIFVICCAD